jgi:hypothetical protein
MILQQCIRVVAVLLCPADTSKMPVAMSRDHLATDDMEYENMIGVRGRVVRSLLSKRQCEGALQGRGA